jgi:hypothetical protein
VGAGFVTETGDEVGSFVGNLAIRDAGTGGDPDQGRLPALQDFGHDGDGFWFQGGGITVTNNIATGATGYGFIYYTKGFVDPNTGAVTQFLSANLPDPAIAHGATFIDSYNVPLIDQGNLTYAAAKGLALYYHLNLLVPSTGGTIEDYTAWNISNHGATFLYAKNALLQDSLLLGNISNPSSSNLGVRIGIEQMDNIRLTNDTVEYFNIGVWGPTNGRVQVSGGTYTNVRSLQVRVANQQVGTTVTVNGGIQFGTLSGRQLQGLTQYNYYMDGDPTLILRDDLFPLSFIQQSTTLNTSQYRNQELYFNQQAGSYVPFVSGSAPSWVPSALLGLTNLQMWNQYGLALGGAIAPSNATTPAGFSGLLGSPASFPPPIVMNSPVQTTQLTGYQLVYTTGRHRVVHPNLFNLHTGWNMLTLTVNGYLHTFLVWGGSF